MPVTVIPKTGINAVGLVAAQLTDVEGVFDTAFNATTAETTRADAAEALLAPKASPTFTGTPSLPTGATGITQTLGNSTTALATMAFVAAAETCGVAQLNWASAAGAVVANGVYPKSGS